MKKPADGEKLTWLNYWTPEMWSLRNAPNVFRADITKYINNLIELAYDGKTDQRAIELLKTDRDWETLGALRRLHISGVQ